MRTITLELLRHGPPHNQLLSPLTPYLALCENHPAVTINVPFEHNQLRYRLDNLCYRHGQEARDFDVRDTARILGELIAQIPGLTAELSREKGEEDHATHLRLIISCSELALIPFEIATSPNGFPGAGQPLSLQSQTPICITREVRRVPDTPCNWARTPKTLVAAAAPSGFDPVPLEAHIQALRVSLEPWLPPHAPQRRLEEIVTILPQATDVQIETACAENEYTHVHLLAHGAEYTKNYDVRYGLALHDARHPESRHAIVSGERLATILRPAIRPEAENLTSPNVVTLASCNSGNAGGVSGIGASVAHALHQAGIPIVIASQFPLTFGGSVRMVEALYDGLLWGIDPRLLLGDLRRRLHSQFPDNHDWASIAAYASLPTPFERGLQEFKLMQARDCAETAFKAVDRMTTRSFYQEYFTRQTEALAEVPVEGMDSVVTERIELAKSKLKALLKSEGTDKVLLYGQLASIEKRLAEINQEKEDGTLNPDSVELLRQSREYYWKAYQQNRSNSWGLVQYLSLKVVLSRLENLPEIPAGGTEEEKRLWHLARSISDQDKNSPDIDISGWAIANLIELHLIAVIVGGLADGMDEGDHAQKALELVGKLIDKRGEDAFEVYSTRRQMARYAVWFNKIARFEDSGNMGLTLSMDLVRALPDIWEGRNSD